jgi:hypothetical protein
VRFCALLLATACQTVPPGAAGFVGQDVQVAEPLLFGFPVADPLAISTRVGVDHDPADGTGLAGDAICLDYLGRGFPHCYDEHDGSDFILDGGFDAMDAGSAQVVAAADGTVVAIEDGHYDRCHADISVGVTCDGNDGVANSIILEHADGTQTWYWHLMSGSQLVEVGDSVSCGDPLASIGSSGLSSMPHLHFEVLLPGGEVTDPYAGPYSQEESLWEDQGFPEGLPGPGCTAR